MAKFSINNNLLSNIANKVNNLETKDIMNLQLIDLSKIYIKKNVRVDYEGIDKLKESIKQYGLLNAINVIKDGEGKYFVLAGNRRFTAFLMLKDEYPEKFSKIQAVVMDISNDTERIKLQLVENVQREDLKPFELAQALKELKDNTNATNKEIGEYLGKSEKWVMDNLKAVEILNHTNTYDIVGENDSITINHVLETKGLEFEQQKELIEEVAATNLTVKEVREIKNEIKNNPEVNIREKVEKVKSKSTYDVVGEKKDNFVSAKLDSKTFKIKKQSIHNLNTIIELIDENVEYKELKEYMIELLSVVNN